MHSYMSLTLLATLLIFEALHLRLQGGNATTLSLASGTGLLLRRPLLVVR